jgi:hypothetical protein
MLANLFGGRAFLGQVALSANTGSTTPPITPADYLALNSKQKDRILNGMNDDQKCVFYAQLYAHTGWSVDERLAKAWCDAAGLKLDRIRRQFNIPEVKNPTTTDPARGATRTQQTTRPMQPSSQSSRAPVPTGYVSPTQVPIAEYAPVATQSQDSQYNQAIQNPIAPSYPQPSYADVATPSAAMPQAAATPGTTGMTPVQEATAGQYSWNRGTAQCAPPMIPDPSGRGCIPGTPTGYGGGGGLPGIPGGLTASVTAAPLTMTTPGSPA